jgi:glutamate-5-semialdehyde dehydrogenase
VLKQALNEFNVNQDAISLLEDTSRETAKKFMQMKEYVDLLIPRGGASLIKSAIENSTIPIIETGTGNCHVYVDEFADLDKAVKIIFNAKTQRYGVCNACESLVIHSKVLDKVLPLIYEKLSEKQVQMRLDDRAYNVLKGKENVVKATEEDFYTEYCDAIISVVVVDDIKQAIAHINQKSTHHSESIITESVENAELFLNNVDSTSVYHNASTRCTDGFVFGLGAEIGISTQKMHARGPMGLEQLTTTKFFIKDVTDKGAIRK